MYVKIIRDNQTTVIQCTEYVLFSEASGESWMFTTYDRTNRVGTEHQIKCGSNVSVYAMSETGATIEKVLDETAILGG